MFSFLRYTPIHPQWLVFIREEKGLRDICHSLRGLVLDIGCADKKIQAFLPPGCQYVGLDYYQTATQWYRSRPHIFGDAQCLAIADESIENVLLLDVLEHLPKPYECLSEIHRILKADGRLIVQVPFMYPIHDAPLDFHRWTIHGLRELAARHRFHITQEVCLGKPPETAALLRNIAATKTVLTWLHRKNPLVFLGILLPIKILVVNIIGWLSGKMCPADEFLADGYRIILVKK